MRDDREELLLLAFRPPQLGEVADGHDGGDDRADVVADRIRRDLDEMALAGVPVDERELATSAPARERDTQGVLLGAHELAAAGPADLEPRHELVDRPADLGGPDAGERPRRAVRARHRAVRIGDQDAFVELLDQSPHELALRDHVGVRARVEH